MTKAAHVCIVLAALASAAGCRRVVLVSFTAFDIDTPDTVAIEGIHPQKDRREFTGLQTVGYFDVEGDSIRVHVQACAGGRLVADNADKNMDYHVTNDEVTIALAAVASRDCPWGPPVNDAGTGGSANQGMGGSAGAPGTGGDVGGVGGIIMNRPDGGDANDDGGTADTGECGTADTHPPTCDPPSGDAGANEVPPPATFSAACDTYCNGLQTKCAGISAGYESLETCRRYCNQAGWSVGDGSNRDDSLGCRNFYLGLVTPGSFNQGLFCANAGPTGNSNCGMLCEDFCAAFTNLCAASTGDTNRCLSACQSSTITCRFQMLQRAVFDRRYCSFVSFDSCLTCN